MRQPEARLRPAVEDDVAAVGRPRLGALIVWGGVERLLFRLARGRFTYKLNVPVRSELNASWEPSGDQTGLVWIPPNVNFERTCLLKSYIQIPPGSLPPIETATLSPSGERRTVPGIPVVSSDDSRLPERSVTMGSTSAAAFELA